MFSVDVLMGPATLPLAPIETPFIHTVIGPPATQVAATCVQTFGGTTPWQVYVPSTRGHREAVLPVALPMARPYWTSKFLSMMRSAAVSLPTAVGLIHASIVS